MNHANYSIVQIEEDRVFIVDLDMGNKSVTNDAEWVWDQIQNDYPGRRLIYRDTMNRWDEMVPVMPSDEFGNTVVSFRPYDEQVPAI